MPATETKSKHPAVEPRELESHEALVGDVLYYIGIYPPTRTGSLVVRAERPDGSNWLATEDEVPQNLKDELNRRLQASKKVPTLAERLREAAEGRAPRIRLWQAAGMADFFTVVCRPFIWNAAGQGQKSVQVRLVLKDGEDGPPTHEQIKAFRKVLKEEGLVIETGSLITEPRRPGFSYTPIIYQTITISWE